MQRDVLWVGNTNAISVEKLINGLTGEYLNTASVEVTVLHGNHPVNGENWPKAMNYQPGSDGEYACTLADTIEISNGQLVTLRVRASQGGVIGLWNIPMLCLIRASDTI